MTGGTPKQENILELFTAILPKQRRATGCKTKISTVLLTGHIIKAVK
jgi:hypothetical protein